jgi:hypothetical protein
MSTPDQDLLDIFDAFATDPELELKGKWFKLGKKARVRVARDGNDNYNEEFKRLFEEHSLALADGGPAADALAADIMLQVQAKTILVGWEGLSFQGKPVEYSVEMAKTMLAVKDFRKKILAMSREFDNFRVKAEEQQGNA